MPRQREKYAPTFSIRLTAKERVKLDSAAGDMPLGAYIRSRLFKTPSPRHYKRLRLDIDRNAIRRIWRELGHQRIASNLSYIVKAIESEDLETDDALEMQLRCLRTDVRALIRQFKEAMGEHPPKGQWGGKREY